MVIECHVQIMRSADSHFVTVHFKYKITKCKYKDIFKPAKQAELDSTRKNIRKDIRDAVRKQIEGAAPELGKDLALVKAEDVWEP